MEVALLSGAGERRRVEISLDEFLDRVGSDPSIQTIPLSLDIAAEVAAIGRALSDPADRIIVATARVHRLKLITSDERIVASGLVPVIA